MKKYFKEIAILIAQLLMFYVFPLTAGPTDAMGCLLYTSIYDYSPIKVELQSLI